jgi:hypothetical protein
MGNADHYGLVPKADDRNVWFAHRAQHMGLSTDGGLTFEWTGKFFDGSHTHAVGFHPTDWQVFAQAQQDRSLILTETAGDYWLSDTIGGPKDGNGQPGNLIVAAIGNDQHISGGGTIIHASGRVVSMQGNSNGKRVPCIMDPSGGNPIGSVLVRTDKVSQVTGFASLDPNDGDQGFMGRFRVGNLAAANPADVGFAEMERFFVGATGAGGATVIYGITNDKDRDIFRSTDRGASWTKWHTAKASFRPVGPELAVCPHSPARVYAVSGDGRVVRIEGEAGPTETRVFDARDFLPPGVPRYEVNSIAVDPRDADLVYVSLFMWGVPNVFRTTDGCATWEDVSGNVPSLDGVLFVHPLTSDVLFGSSHGTWVLPPPAAHAAAFATASSVWSRARAFVQGR